MKSVAGMSISVAAIRDIVKILEQVKMKDKKKKKKKQVVL